MCREQVFAALSHIDVVSQWLLEGAEAARCRFVACCVWAVWSTSVGTKKLTRSAEVLEARFVSGRCSSRAALVRAVGWGSRRVHLHWPFCAWVRGTSGRMRQEAFASERRRLAVQRVAKLAEVIDRMAVAQPLGHLRVAWQLWWLALIEAQRSRAEHVLLAKEDQRMQQLDHAHQLLMTSGARAQAAMIARACLLTWRCLHHLSDSKELGRLRADCSRQCRIRAVQIEGLGLQLAGLYVSMLVHVVWMAWRRRRREAAMLNDLESAQQLLAALWAERLQYSAQEPADIFLAGAHGFDDRYQAAGSLCDAVSMTSQHFAGVPVPPQVPTRSLSQQHWQPAGLLEWSVPSHPASSGPSLQRQGPRSPQPEPGRPEGLTPMSQLERAEPCQLPQDRRRSTTMHNIWE
eukprot:gnl/TRDRNA2_/TRDRNA2_149491_c2_seq1.p1 gnl/TRDRNA2_/TRDRNA2_149491_c2~~gnl/TRDRNA2_/TRDRNA2_149491_c2_seq1.p1  ORF type:complete len:457 (-),score=57.40 gnl/TRDRNA2_/TRDRNA2_149491_c2_seq1:103-1314(-)